MIQFHVPRASVSLLIVVAAVALAGCGGRPKPAEEVGHVAAAAGEYERGPHRGRMLRDGDFALEVTSSRMAFHLNSTSTPTARTSRSARARSPWPWI